MTDAVPVAVADTDGNPLQLEAADVPVAAARAPTPWGAPDAVLPAAPHAPRVTPAAPSAATEAHIRRRVTSTPISSGGALPHTTPTPQVRYWFPAAPIPGDTGLRAPGGGRRGPLLRPPHRLPAGGDPAWDAMSHVHPELTSDVAPGDAAAVRAASPA
ncbi:MAG: hypothetical protein M0Z42_24705 [Actinomycetota bacterium]|nr:hypothetical protein [Actinomycetota bacterium]